MNGEGWSLGVGDFLVGLFFWRFQCLEKEKTIPAVSAAVKQ